jgi:signal peptidase I
MPEVILIAGPSEQMFKIVQVKGQSMAPTLQGGERVLAWTPFSKRLFRCGHIVTLLRSNTNLLDARPTQEDFRVVATTLKPKTTLYIKRIIGMPGSVVLIPIARMSGLAISTIDPQAVQHEDRFQWHVPQGHVFVCGDGIDSGDSISWGSIPISQLRQVVLCRFPSFQRIP